MGLEIRKLLPLVIIQTRWYNTMPFWFCVYVLESYVLRKSISSGWCWVNFQYRGILQIWIREGQVPTALSVGAGGGCLEIFSLIYLFSFLSPSLWETAWYRLKYCLKGLISPKQPTNQQAWYFHVPAMKQCYLPVHIYNQIISFERPAKFNTKFWIAFKHRAKWWKWSKI